MLPLTRATFEQLIPAVATGAQYNYCWGSFSDVLRRLLFSVLGVTIVLLVGGVIASVFGAFSFVQFFLGIGAAFYWMWGPAFQASRRNWEYRKYRYSALWQGKILDLYLTEELLGITESVNNKGDLVRTEKQERYLNVEVGDRTGFTTEFKLPLRKEHRQLKRGQLIQLVLLAKDADFRLIAKTTDAYVPELNLWVSDYPYVQRDVFKAVNQRLTQRGPGDLPLEPRRSREDWRDEDDAPRFSDPRDRDPRDRDPRDRDPRDRDSSRRDRNRRPPLRLRDNPRDARDSRPPRDRYGGPVADYPEDRDEDSYEPEDRYEDERDSGDRYDDRYDERYDGRYDDER